MGNGDEAVPLFHGKVGTILIAMASASLVVTIFHLIILCRTHRHVTDQNTPQAQSTVRSASAPPHPIPAHKYEKKRKGAYVAGGDEDGTCAVCLGEYEEGEEVRTLPECTHSFHVACIDTWLHSHSSCPLCRTQATPSPANHHHHLSPPNHHAIDIVQNGLAAPPEILRSNLYI